MVLASLIEIQMWCLPEPAGWARGGLNQETMASASTSICDKAASPVLALKPESQGSSESRLPILLIRSLVLSESPLTQSGKRKAFSLYSLEPSKLLFLV